MRRTLAGLMLVGAATGGPYLLFESAPGKQLTQIAGGQRADGGTQSNSIWSSWFGSTDAGEQSPDTSAGQSYHVQPIQALSEVLRFDISPSWVPMRFPRVSTVLADLNMDGLRVPLVTGTQPTDLAGTLTYYFDRFQRVQRITVHAVTGDPSRFITELRHGYQLQQQPALGGGLYLKKWNGRATSLAFVAPAPVISAEDPYSRYQLFIELNQAGLEFGLSQEAQELLASGTTLSRW